MATSETITIKDAARLLNYSEQHIRRLINQGHLPKRQRDKRCQVMLPRDVILQLKARWGR